MSNFKKNLLDALKVTALAAVLTIGVNYLSAWSGPPGTPPSCPSGYPGCDAPIHIGIQDQTKAGDICTTKGGTTKCLTNQGNLVASNQIRFARGHVWLDDVTGTITAVQGPLSAFEYLPSVDTTAWQNTTGYYHSYGGLMCTTGWQFVSCTGAVTDNVLMGPFPVNNGCIFIGPGGSNTIAGVGVTVVITCVQ